MRSRRSRHPPSLKMLHSHIHFVLGGSRSGKSAFAEALALNSTRPVVYVATCRTVGLDTEMQDRLRLHRERRPPEWKTIENQFDFCRIAEENPNACLLIDCLTLWVSNAMEESADIDGMLKKLEVGLQAMARHNCQAIIVSCEIGLGIIPLGQEIRLYRDSIGSANQLVAKHAARVDFLAAGLPIKLK